MTLADLRPAAVLAALGLLGAGPAPVPPPNPCQLLTGTQIAAAVGAKVGAGAAIGPTGCQWIGSTNPSVRVTVTLSDPAVMTGAKAPLPGVAKKTAAGIGDEAVYATIGSLTTLTVRKNHSVFIVRIYGLTGQTKQMAAEKTLALEVLPGV